MSDGSNDNGDSPRKPPVYPPFLDEEERYQRDPNTVTQRTENAIDRIGEHFDHLRDSIEIFYELLAPEQRQLLRHLERDANDAVRSLDVLIAVARELSKYNGQLTDQRQSARAAYDRGWREAIQEVMLHLHPDDQAMLQRALDGEVPPDPDDDWDDLPF